MFNSRTNTSAYSRSSPSSPKSPTSPRNRDVPPGFRPSQRPKQRPIPEMTIRELQDLHRLNATILASPYVFSKNYIQYTQCFLIILMCFRGASTSTYVQRVLAEQAAVESRLLELDGMEAINVGLKNTKIRGENDMVIDSPPEPPTSRTLEAKRKALAQFVCNFLSQIVF